MGGVDLLEDAERLAGHVAAAPIAWKAAFLNALGAIYQEIDQQELTVLAQALDDKGINFIEDLRVSLPATD
jgi:hypothetical protein